MAEVLPSQLSRDIEALARRFLAQVCQRKLTLATVESCTGGLIRSILTDIGKKRHAFDQFPASINSRSGNNRGRSDPFQPWVTTVYLWSARAISR